jgi:phage-related protein
MPGNPKWSVVMYRDVDGNEPVREYICSPGHNETDIATIVLVIENLMALGEAIHGTKMDKLIDGPIRELRKDRHRILYGRDGDKYVLLSGFLKASQKTPSEEIRLAQRRFEDYLKNRQRSKPLRM